MSCALYYRPVNKKEFRVGDFVLRNILENKFGYPHKLNSTHIEYLKGLDDAQVDGAYALIEAIYKYEEIEIYKEC